MPLKRLATAIALIVPVMYVRYATKMPDSATMVERMAEGPLRCIRDVVLRGRRRGFVGGMLVRSRLLAGRTGTPSRPAVRAASVVELPLSKTGPRK